MSMKEKELKAAELNMLRPLTKPSLTYYRFVKKSKTSSHERSHNHALLVKVIYTSA